MIEHVSLRCSDPKVSRAFYERALRPLGYEVTRRYGDAFGFQQDSRLDFWISKGKVGTPTHLAFHAKDRREVEAFYRSALRSGGQDNGPPGMREDYGFAAFIHDPDGHNVEAVVWPEDESAPRRRPRAAAKRKRSAARRRRRTH